VYFTAMSAPARRRPLAFDATAVLRGKGLARFQAEFLRALAELELVEELVVFVEPGGADVLPQPAGWSFVEVRTRPMLRWEQAGMPAAARRLGVRAIVTTSERAPLWGPPRVPFVFEHPRHRAERARADGVGRRQRAADLITLALFPLAMRRAPAVIAASRSTAADLTRYANAIVVPAAVPASFTRDDARAEAVRKRLGLADGYLLHLASDDARENTETVLAALGRLAALGERPPLVVAGRVQARRPALERQALELGVAKQLHWLGFAPDEELADLYRGGLAYVDPSLYEGFGFQALEALACGTPVVSSDRTSLPEVVGDGGVLVDAVDADGFARALHTLLTDPAEHAAARGRALAQAARFSWERTVRRTLEIADSVSRA
jgi:glycosyltransferase involved in cell wall biosynthesis